MLVQRPGGLLQGSPAVAAVYAAAGAGRPGTSGHDGLALSGEIRQIYDNSAGSLNTDSLVAAIRHPMHVVEAAKIGAEVVTVPPKILRQLVQHTLTDKGLAAFLADWRKTGQTIVKD